VGFSRGLFGLFSPFRETERLRVEGVPLEDVLEGEGSLEGSVLTSMTRLISTTRLRGVLLGLFGDVPVFGEVAVISRKISDAIQNLISIFAKQYNARGI
jgi:hypothetical protein